MALAEKRAGGTVERAEARTASAEASERGLRASVEAIKVDFEVGHSTFFLAIRAGKGRCYIILL